MHFPNQFHVVLALGALALWPAAHAVTVRDAQNRAVNVADISRVVTLGGPVTETVFALGVGPQVVATDISSNYPAAAAALPRVGYYRQLSAESIIALKPTLVIGNEDSGPPVVLEQLQAANIALLILPKSTSPAVTKKNIVTLGQVFGRDAQATALNRNLDAQLVQAARLRSSVTRQVKVMFIYARGSNMIQVGGRNTSADGMIRLAGGRNVFSNFEGYRPLTPEAAVSANPDYILMLNDGLASVGGVEGVLKLPGIAQTNAGKNRRIISMDGNFLLDFGPRLGDAAKDLALKLYPDLHR